MKDLTYLLARTTNTPLATFDNDAKSCYDRIVMIVALLLAFQQGLPKTTAAWIAQTTSLMQKFVQTSFGVNNQFWGYDDGTVAPQRGFGQGH